MEKILMGYASQWHGGSGGLSKNPNDLLGRFNYNNWWKRQTIYLYDGESGYNADVAHDGYIEVSLPWATKDKEVNIPDKIWQELKPENGWELVLNYCGFRDMKNANFIFLYNKYTGIMRVLFYMPDNFKSGGDHLWEVQLSDNLALRSPWKYGIPCDGKIEKKAAIDQEVDGHMQNLITPWFNKWGVNGAIVPMVGWWAFDIDMSLYRPNHDISTNNDNIMLAMHSWDDTKITLSGTIKQQAYVDTGEGPGASDAFNGFKTLFSISGNLAGAYASFGEGKVADALKSIGDIFGTIGGLFDETGGAVGLSTFDVNLEGFAKTGKVTTGIPTPTIPMTDFDFKHSHLGKGVWNLHEAPIIYMTDCMLNNINYSHDRREAHDVSWWNKLKDVGRNGCLWFFDPTSVNIDLNPDVFPEKDIEWIQVDAVPGARQKNKVSGTDNYRKFLGLRARDYKHVKEDRWKSVNNYNNYKSRKYLEESNAMTDYYYSEKYPDEVSYFQYAYDKQESETNIVWGVGIWDKVIFEPQMSWRSSDSYDVAPPVEIDVRLAIKMKGHEKPFVFNRVYLPEIEHMGSSQKEFEDSYNRIKDYKLSDKQNGHRDVYDHNVKRIYEKVKAVHYNANISK